MSCRQNLPQAPIAFTIWPTRSPEAETHGLIILPESEKQQSPIDKPVTIFLPAPAMLVILRAEVLCSKGGAREGFAR
jgi:hypothetical protein